MSEYEKPAIVAEGDLEVRAGSWWCDELDFELDIDC